MLANINNSPHRLSGNLWPFSRLTKVSALHVHREDEDTVGANGWHERTEPPQQDMVEEGSCGIDVMLK